jgi:hypothetical protein
MHTLRSLLERLTTEHLGWFGAGLSVAAVALVGCQLLASVLGQGGLWQWPSSMALPGPQPEAASPDAFPTRTLFPTRTPYPTNTPYPTRTPLPTRTPSPTPTPAPTRSPRPTPTPFPTRTPYPTRTPTPVAPFEPPDALLTEVLADPDAVVGAVATFAARANQAVDALQPTPGSHR